MSKIQIYYESGRVSCVATPLYGLAYWLMEQEQDVIDENLTLEVEIGRVKLYSSNCRVLSHDDEELIPSVVAAIERRWNKTPEFDEEFNVQDRAMEILFWLEKEGDITKLELN